MLKRRRERRSSGVPAAARWLCALASLGIATSAAAGPALYQASFIMHAFGNDITTGTQLPYNTSTFVGMPLGHDCHRRTPYTTYGGTAAGYCSPAVIQAGAPAIGSGTLSVGTGMPSSIALPQSAFRITVTGEPPSYYPYLKTTTYATFANASGFFFAGGGPAAGIGQKIKTGKGQVAGSWIIHEGVNGFGGAMGLLGKLGAWSFYVVPGVAGDYTGTASWNMVVALGRVRFATPTSYSPKGKAINWLNPHLEENVYTNEYNGKQSTLALRGSGTPWTTGSVTVYATAGVFTTILHRAGYDGVTPSGARNIQLVTPALTHWVGPGFQTHTGHIGILKLTIAPEPGAWLSLMAGLASLLALRRAARRR